MHEEYKINDIFYSIQGEGRNAGIAAIFIRFAGCNLSCSFCDTDFTKKMSLNLLSIMAKIKQFPQCQTIVLTGGEPSYQENISELIYQLKYSNYTILVETNGYNFKAIEKANYITFSPKNLELNFIGKLPYDELKVVYQGQDMKAYNKYLCFNDYVQPLSKGSITNIDKCVDFVKENPIWKLSLQTHKLIGIK